jgi:peptidoglycan/LPS O-acetylase OafA/YrhL
VGDPVGTVPWFVAVALAVLALLFLLATPYTPDWDLTGDTRARRRPVGTDAWLVPRKEHHPIRGIVGGLLLGLALGLGSIVYSFNELGVTTPWALVGLGLVIGVVMVFLPSRKAMKARPDSSESTGTFDAR